MNRSLKSYELICWSICPFPNQLTKHDSADSSHKNAKGDICVEQPPDTQELPSPSRIIQLWKIYRDYVVNENLLIHQRLQRMLAVQAFLFAALGASVSEFSKRYSEFEGFCQAEQHAGLVWPYQTIQPGLFLWFGMLIALVAMGLVWVSGLALKATRLARKHLKESWEQRFGVRAGELGLPALRGGGSEKAHRLGDKHLKVLPWIFVGMWAIVAIGLAVILAQINANPYMWQCR